MDTLRQNVDPPSWQAGRGCGMEYKDRMLIVTQTPENQKAVASAIENMRRLRERQVVIDGYFLSVPAKDESSLLEWMKANLGIEFQDTLAKRSLNDEKALSLMAHVKLNPERRFMIVPRLTAFARQRAKCTVATMRELAMPRYGQSGTATGSLMTGVMLETVATPADDLRSVGMQVGALSSTLQEAGKEVSYTLGKAVVEVQAPDQHYILMRVGPLKRMKALGVKETMDNTAGGRLQVDTAEVPENSDTRGQPQGDGNLREHVYVLLRPQIIAKAASTESSQSSPAHTVTAKSATLLTSKPAIQPAARPADREVVDIEAKSILVSAAMDSALRQAMPKKAVDGLHADGIALLDQVAADSLLKEAAKEPVGSQVSWPTLHVPDGGEANVVVNSGVLKGLELVVTPDIMTGRRNIVVGLQNASSGMRLESGANRSTRPSGAPAELALPLPFVGVTMGIPNGQTLLLRLTKSQLREVSPGKLRLTIPPPEPTDYIYVLLKPTIADSATQRASSPTSQPAMQPATQATSTSIFDIDPLATKNMLKLDLEDVALEDALERLHRDSGYIIHANWAAMKVISVDPKTPVSVKLEDATLREALDAILTSAAGPGMLRYEYSDKVVQITSASDAATMGIVVRVYDVRDLMGPVAERTAEDLEKLIHENVAPGTWGPAPRIGSIKFVNKSMIVTQSVEAHEAVTKLLANLRRQVVKASTALFTRPSSEPSASAASTLPYAKRSQFDATRRGDH